MKYFINCLFVKVILLQSGSNNKKINCYTRTEIKLICPNAQQDIQFNQLISYLFSLRLQKKAKSNRNQQKIEYIQIKRKEDFIQKITLNQQEGKIDVKKLNVILKQSKRDRCEKQKLKISEGHSTYTMKTNRKEKKQEVDIYKRIFKLTRSSYKRFYCIFCLKLQIIRKTLEYIFYQKGKVRSSHNQKLTYTSFILTYYA
ncbi:hypothetical protein TTHERM_000784619 (macronuclear) [Tetrahymena thermophila SB210]|uniref:Uncharacterized protein n=1 Tax=Tetrahymena thermophila (strain SB210) TaxID=312017 RepID=W7XFA6_TETTS|nr:hypothetical protein TTHERM_000784619 [Tetrahymena thermophila SB210]EWS75513.1 hypothetical protein TTHERM_000784619 [Tetrahymena thermophila SB210]|eukprot:XP_012651982.1 hypothetical protein TTHERM_000784619 [Tetrahymena thermophila SB210]